MSADEIKVPVVVTYTYTHVVWVEAPELEDGQPLAEAMKDAASAIDDGPPYEHTDDKQTLVDAYWDVRVPTAMDFQIRVYASTGHPGGGSKADAHVRRHQQVQREQLADNVLGGAR